MARAVGEIEREILALSTQEKETLLNVLISDLDVPYDEMRLLAIQLNDATERSGKALEAAVARLGQFDEEMRRLSNCRGNWPKMNGVWCASKR